MKEDEANRLDICANFDEGVMKLKAVMALRGFTLALEGPMLVRGGVDAILNPGGVKLHIERRSSIQSALNAVRGGLPTEVNGRRVLFLVPGLTAGMLAECREEGLCVADAAGNIFLATSGIYIEHYLQKGRAIRPTVAGSIFTARSSRIIRALLARYPKACRQKELAEWTGVSPGYVSTRIRMMERDGYIVHEGESIRISEPDRLLTAWAGSYRFDRHRRLHYAISMTSYEQGCGKVQAELKRIGLQYAFTGWAAAYFVAPYGEPENIMAYVSRYPDPDVLRFLHPVDEGGGVLLLVPHDEGVLQFPVNLPGKPPLVSYAQLYIDLVRMSGRAPEQAEFVRKKCLVFEEGSHDR
jgi:DNA-binding Lrp family transcriptional regulator